MTEEDNALVERLAALIRSNVQVTVYPDEPCSYDYEVDAYDAAEAIAAEIERLSAALERAIEAIQAIQAERDCLVECATMPPDHDLSTLDPDTKPHVEEYDAMLAYLRAALGKDASDVRAREEDRG